MMRALFIDPLGDTESSGLNIGIAYCASAVMEMGHVVSVLDLVNIRGVDGPLARIKKAVEEFVPDVIGISVTNMSFNNSRSYAADIRAYFKGAIVLGGPEITAMAGRSLELIRDADMAVVGEGEITLVELLEAMETGRSLQFIKGLVWRNCGDITVNPSREFMRDLDKIRFPNYDVFGVDRMDVYPIVTTRGCPYGCCFCFSHLGKKWRARSAENVIEELKAARARYRIKLFHISDGSFNVDIGRVEKFCRLLIDEGLDMPWVIQGFRADRITEGMMQSLNRANCKRIWVGIETLEEDVFRNINKGETLEDIKKGIVLMKKYKMEIFGYMLMGLPGDTFEKTLRSFENARKFKLDLLAYSSCVPFTGTKIEAWAKENGRMLADSHNISSIGSRYNKIAFDTEDFTVEERARARRILNIRSGSYDEPETNPAVFKIKKWMLIFRYDFRNMLSRIRSSIAYRMRYGTSVDNINLKRGIYFHRLPDGTWGLAGGDVPKGSGRKRFFLDLKRMTCAEMDEVEQA